MTIPRFISTPYKKINTILDTPYRDLAYLLGRYNIPKANFLAESLYRFVKNESLISYLDILYTIAQPIDVLPLVVGRAWISGQNTNLETLRPIIASSPRPLIQCYSDDDFDNILSAASDRNYEEVRDILREKYIYDDIPDYDLWLESPYKITTYLRRNNSDIAQLSANLLNGEIYEVFEEIVYLESGENISDSFNEELVMKTILNGSLGIILPGYE
mgnify:CR=1 FL=1